VCNGGGEVISQINTGRKGLSQINFFRLQIFSVPDPGAKKAPDPESGSATLALGIHNTAFRGMVETVSGSIRFLGGTEIALCLATARKGQQSAGLMSMVS
jgi:hypothetical protein